jgi:hypothetical protein
MCEYAVLGLIYDQVSDIVERDRLCTINISDLRSGLWDTLQLDYLTVASDGEKIRSRINSAIDHVRVKTPIAKLVKQGESQTLEFKETLEYDTQNTGKNKEILFSSLKTIAGFLNARGGTLLIGVDDSGKPRGIERDLSMMKHANNDRFEQKIRNWLKDRFNPHPIGKVSISFRKLSGATICRVDVQASEDVTHLDGKVCVRDGNTTLWLEGPTLTGWIEKRRTRH